MPYLKKLLLLSFVLVFLFSISPASPAGANTFKTTAASAVIMDAETGQVLYGKKENQRKEPASLTKIMTSIIAIEYGHLDEIVTVSNQAANIYVGQQIKLAKGEKITLENLLKAALIYSANDSTVAIAQHLSGSEESFIKLMNTKALVLGAHNTRFANTNGYHHPNHYTTAYDLALITRYTLNNKEFAKIVSTPKETIYWTDSDRKLDISNTNRLIRNNSYPGIIGVKTGSTIRAGNCLIAAAKRGDRTLIAVILHSKNRFQDAVKMLDYGFNNFSEETLCSQGEELGQAPLSGGTVDSVKAVSEKPVKVYLTAEDKTKISKKIIYKNNLTAPVQLGDKVGEAIFSIGEKELARVSLVAGEQAKEPGIIDKIKQRINE